MLLCTTLYSRMMNTYCPLLSTPLRFCYVVFTVAIISLAACVPPTEEVITEVDIDLGTAAYQQLYKYIDQRNLDSILSYTSHPDPAYRYTMAIGLSSMQDEKAMDSLTLLLQDPIIKVRSAAAYALGQLGAQGAVTSLMESFRRKDTLDVDNIFNATILEAIGKTADKGLLEAIATVSTYRKTDSLLLQGQARAIYRFGLRGLYHPKATSHMADLVLDSQYPLSTRQLAASYLHRFFKDLDLSDYSKRLTKAYIDSPRGLLRNSLASVVTRIGDTSMASQLLDLASDGDADYRERIEIIKQLGQYPYIQVVDKIIVLLSDANLHVAHAAADYLVHHGNPSDAALYHSFIKAEMRFSVKAKIYQAVLQNIPVYYTNTKNKYKRDMQTAIDSATLLQEKTAYITALAADPYAYEQLIDIGLGTDVPAIRSTVAAALSTLILSPRYLQAYRSSMRYHTQRIVAGINTMIKSGDAGVIAVAGDLLSSTEPDFTPFIKDSLALYEKALTSLPMPGNIEAYNALSKAISKAKGKQYEARIPAYNQPIDWSKLTKFGDTIVAVIKTSKGNIKLHLDPVHAPASVANFITLAQDDYYDNKTIHRVVPNFVIQGGCSRGDGYGGLNYTIRSELGPHYYDQEGYIGMASAGRDTEGTQWFITQSLTPHLDGRYTIFGRVVEGMDVVHTIMPGDISYDVIISRL